MERFVGVLLCLVMLTSVYLTPITSKESEEIVLTKDGNAYLDNRIEQVEIRYLTDKDFEKLYTCKADVRCESKEIVSLTQADAWKFMKLSKCEDDSDAITQAYIMSVLYNRLKSKGFPNTVDELLAQDGQFSCVKDGRFDKAEPDINSHIALYLLESGQVKTDFLYFEAESLEDSWQSKHREFACVSGKTRFYR